MASQMQQYLDNLDELVRTYSGQIIAVRNGKVLGQYSSKLAAWRDMKKKNLKDGEYAIVKCEPDPDSYSFFWANGFFKS